MIGVVPTAVVGEKVEGAGDVGDAVENLFVAFAVPNGAEAAFFDEVIKEWPRIDVIVAFGDGEVAFARERWGEHG